MDHLLEPPLMQWRIRQVLPDFPTKGVLVDIGCGNPPALINRVKEKMDRCIGVDSAVSTSKNKKVSIVKQYMRKKIKIPARSADVVTLLAILEHLDYPAEIVSECYRILKPRGKLLLTVPSPKSQMPLKFLTSLDLVDPVMVSQHKRYFTHQQLRRILSKAGFSRIRITSFQVGLNTYVKAVKT